MFKNIIKAIGGDPNKRDIRKYSEIVDQIGGMAAQCEAMSDDALRGRSDELRTQVREARSQSSYLSVSDARLHFGLGAADRVDRIEVRWPGGGVQRLSNVQADRVVVIEEDR